MSVFQYRGHAIPVETFRSVNTDVINESRLYFVLLNEVI